MFADRHKVYIRKNNINQAQNFSKRLYSKMFFQVFSTKMLPCVIDMKNLECVSIFQLTFMCKLAVFVNKNTYQKTLTLLNLKIYDLLFSATVSTIKFQNYKVFLILQSMTSLEFVGWNFCTFWLSVEITLISRDSVKTQQTYCFRPRYTLMYH